MLFFWTFYSSKILGGGGGGLMQHLAAVKNTAAFLAGSFEVEMGLFDFYASMLSASSKHLLDVVRLLTVKGDLVCGSQKMLSVCLTCLSPISLSSFLHPSLRAMFRWALEIEHGG